MLHYPAPQPASAIAIGAFATGEDASQRKLTIAIDTMREDVLGVSLQLLDASAAVGSFAELCRCALVDTSTARGVLAVHKCVGDIAALLHCLASWRHAQPTFGAGAAHR